MCSMVAPPEPASPAAGAAPVLALELGSPPCWTVDAGEAAAATGTAGGAAAAGCCL
jgi:hypothetical protein